MSNNFIYFDNATTSRPKAPGLIKAICDFYSSLCMSPGHSNHILGGEASLIVQKARELTCTTFGAQSPDHIVFTSGATESINLVIKSLIQSGDKVVVSDYDHNSVLRTVIKLKKSGSKVCIVQNAESRDEILERYMQCISKDTRLVVVNHASNVNGTILPVREISEYAKMQGAIVLVDGAQSAGWVDCNVNTLGADYFVTSMHKALLGPFGLGVLVINNNDVVLQPLRDGGTGLESENLTPKSIIPSSLEAGTMNMSAIAASIAAFEYTMTEEMKVNRILVKELFKKMISRLGKYSKIKYFGPNNEDDFVPVVSIRHNELSVMELRNFLEFKHGILCRGGLQCSPLRHLALGTSPEGTVRVSFGHKTSEGDVEVFLHALSEIEGE
jgi:cysteine desulfurase / selenocysteine lyase